MAIRSGWACVARPRRAALAGPKAGGGLGSPGAVSFLRWECDCHELGGRDRAVHGVLATTHRIAPGLGLWPISNRSCSPAREYSRPCYPVKDRGCPGNCGDCAGGQGSDHDKTAPLYIGRCNVGIDTGQCRSTLHSRRPWASPGLERSH
jgi:hypothetical protein